MLRVWPAQVGVREASTQARAQEWSCITWMQSWRLNQNLGRARDCWKIGIVLSCTYMPTNLYTAWRYARGHLESCEREFALEGVTKLEGATQGESLHNLPCSLSKSDFWRVASIEAYSGWACHRVFKAWILALTSTKAWSGWPCHRVFKAWVLASRSTKAWSGWPCHRVFKAWHLATCVQPKPGAGELAIESSELDIWQSCSTEAWSGWACHRVFESLTFGNVFNRSLERVSLPSSLQSLSFGIYSTFNHSLERVTLPLSLQSLCFGDSCLTKAWTGWPCHRVFKAWVLVSEFNQSLERVTLPLESSKLEFWRGCSTKAWTGWPCHQVFKAWVLVSEFQPKPGAGDLATESSKLEHLAMSSTKA